MALLTRGGTTFGNRTTAQIDALTGMAEGDTVFDTSLKRYRVYDGLGWAGDNIIVQKISTGLASAAQGNLIRPSSVANNEIGLPSVASGNLKLITATSVSTVTKAQNEYCPVSYLGVQPAKYDGVGASVDPTEYVQMSTGVAGQFTETTLGSGTAVFGVALETSNVAGALVNIIFRSTEKA